MPACNHLFTVNHVHQLFLHLSPRGFTTMWPIYCSYGSGLDRIAFLSTRLKAPDVSDLMKLNWVMKCQSLYFSLKTYPSGVTISYFEKILGGRS